MRFLIISVVVIRIECSSKSPMEVNSVVSRMKVSRPDEYSLISFKTVTETASSGQLASAMIKGQKSDSLFLGPKANVLPRKPNNNNV